MYYSSYISYFELCYISTNSIDFNYININYIKYLTLV
jgi:hypothetical protein